MASPSCSFSALLNSSTACGLSSDYPSQVEGWALKYTKKAYRFNEKQKANLDAKFAKNWSNHWQKVRWWHVKWDVHSGQMVFAFSKSQSFTANLVLLLVSCSQDPPTTSQWCRYQGKRRSRQLCSSKGNCHYHEPDVDKCIRKRINRSATTTNK